MNLATCRIVGAAAAAWVFVLFPVEAAWNVETVDGTANTGQAASLALNPLTGEPAIAYNRWHGEAFPNNFYPYFAIKAGASWTLEELDTSLTTFSSATSVGFNSLGEPAVTYTFFSTNVRYKVRSGGMWGSALNVATNNGGGFSSLVMQGNAPAVAFIDGAGQDLEYATLNNNTFTNQELDATNAAGPVSMGQSDNVMAIVYIDAGKLACFYSINGGMNWGLMPAFPTNINAAYCALTVGPSTKNGDPFARSTHIIYYDSSNGLYRYITNDTDTGTWTAPETVFTSSLDTLSTFGLSIALDSNSLPHVALLDYDSKRLVYVKRTTTGWSAPEFPDGANLGGVNAAIRLTSAGKPRIAFAALAFSNAMYRPAGLKFAALVDDPVPSAALSFTISGKTKRLATKAAIKISGLASPAVTSIQWKIGGKPYRNKAIAGGRWNVRVTPLRPGRNVVAFRAAGSGATSAVRKIIVTRPR